MITEQDLKEAIAECQGTRYPTASTCIKLAAYLTIQRELYGSEPPGYSFAAPVETTIQIKSDTEFAELINGRYPEEVWPLMDELMTALQVINPKLYQSIIRKLRAQE